jgi:DNA-binding MarR family transcriptional regulator
LSEQAIAPLFLSVILRAMRQIKVAFATGLSSGVPVSPAQYRILARLRSGQATVSELAEWHAVSLPTATKILDGLVERGWVDRQRSADDRRQVLLALTEAGKEVLAELDRLGLAVAERVLSGLTPEEQELVRLALLALDRAMPAESAGGAEERR